MDREQLRTEFTDVLDRARNSRFVNYETRILALAARGVLSVDGPVANNFLDEVLKNLPRNLEK